MGNEATLRDETALREIIKSSAVDLEKEWKDDEQMTLESSLKSSLKSFNITEEQYKSFVARMNTEEGKRALKKITEILTIDDEKLREEWEKEQEWLAGW